MHARLMADKHAGCLVLLGDTAKQAVVWPVVGNRPCVHDDLRPAAAQLLCV